LDHNQVEQQFQSLKQRYMHDGKAWVGAARAQEDKPC
jgi:hypothetical protein